MTKELQNKCWIQAPHAGGQQKGKASYVSATNRKPELSPKQTPLSSSTGETGVREAYSEPATTKTVAEKTLNGNRQLKTQ